MSSRKFTVLGWSSSRVNAEGRNTRSIYKSIIETKKDGNRRLVLKGGNNGDI
jgi:hypothetical protein